MTFRTFVRFLLRDLPRLLLGVLIITAVALNFANIVGRYFFLRPIPWAEEVLTFMFVWSVFIGVSVIAYERTHLSVDILVDAFPAKMRAVVDWVVVLLTVIVCAYAAYQAWIVAALMFRINSVSLTAKIPIGIPYSAFVAGFSLIAVATLAGTLLRGDTERTDLSESDPFS